MSSGLYIYWMILIAKMAIRMFKVKKVEQDIRCRLGSLLFPNSAQVRRRGVQ